MESNQHIKKIKRYAVISFLLPLITINSCLLLYKLLGNIDTYIKYDWNQEIIEITSDEYFNQIRSDPAQASGGSEDNKNLYSERSLILCPENEYISYWETRNDQKIFILKIDKNKINNRCVKNFPFVYFVLKNFSWIEKILLNTKINYNVGFSTIKNPYFYGEVSISRTARYFPATLIFKPLIILSSIFLLLYWRNNLGLFKELENKNLLRNFSKKFFYFGILSCIFLILHASFLGLDFDSKLFTKIRRLIIILFILFEVLAQFFLTKNLLKFKKDIKNYINPLILNLKIVFVTMVLFGTCIVFALLVWGDLSTSLKHILEWNYFSILLVYYLLSRLLWKHRKT